MNYMEQDNQSFGAYYKRPNTNTDSNMPEHSDHPQYGIPNLFARLAQILGIFSILLALSFTIVAPLITGSLAIILALLSRGASSKMHPTAKTGVQTAVASFGINGAILVLVCVIAFFLPKSEEFNTEFQEMTGMSFEEMMERAADGTLDYEEYYENINEYMNENLYEDME